MNTTERFAQTWGKLRNREYRAAFSAAQFKRFVPFQITAIRKARGWSQEKLADESGLTQGVISRAEDQNNGNLAVNTILKIANGLDLVFIGKFVSYREFDEWFKKTSDKIEIDTFEEQDAELKSKMNAPLLFSVGRNKNKENIEASRAGNCKGQKDVTPIDSSPEHVGLKGNEQEPSQEQAAAAGGQK